MFRFWNHSKSVISQDIRSTSPENGPLIPIMFLPSGQKNERVVVHILHIAVLVLVSSQLFAVRWGEVRWGGLFTLMFTRSRGHAVLRTSSLGGWGGVGWAAICSLHFHTHTRHATLLYVFLHFHTDDMLRSCMFACISTQTSC